MTSLQRRLEREEYCRAATELCAGLSAQVDHKVEGNRSIRTLVITKDGKPFEDFSIGATMDWMSGTFCISGRVILKWDRGRRTKRREGDCWEFHAHHIADTINYFSKEAARIQAIRDSILHRANEKRKRKKVKHVKG